MVSRWRRAVKRRVCVIVGCPQGSSGVDAASSEAVWDLGVRWVVDVGLTFTRPSQQERSLLQ